MGDWLVERWPYEAVGYYIRGLATKISNPASAVSDFEYAKKLAVDPWQQRVQPHLSELQGVLAARHGT